MDAERCTTGLAVVKVGGSLYDLPDLGPRLLAFLDALASRPVLLVPGGGPVADAVRAFDHVHGLGEEAAHWLALQALAVNAGLLAALLTARKPRVTGQLADGRLRQPGEVIVLDPYQFARADEGRPGALPHHWDVTSDSVAARVASVSLAAELILLKSVDVPDALDLAEAARRGLVDAYFPCAVGEVETRAGPGSGAAGLRPPLTVGVINFRTWRPGPVRPTALRSAPPA